MTLHLAVFISSLLFLSGLARAQQSAPIKITTGLNGFEGRLVTGGGFGGSLANVGDLNADGFDDLVVGAPAAETVWIVMLNRNAIPRTPYQRDGLPESF